MYGASGYLGGELLRRLLLHPEVEVVKAYAADHLGRGVAEAHLNLEGATSLLIEAVPDQPPDDLDIVFLALPHTVSWAVVSSLLPQRTRVIDLSGAFRLRTSTEYAARYGAEHPLPHLLDQFVYGLPELNRAAITGCRFVANPGCFATALELSLLPLAQAGYLSGTVRAVGITGSSGSGASPSSGTHHPVRATNVRAYQPLRHPHAQEVAHALNQAGAKHLRLDFVPISGPLVRGIYATSFVSVPDGVTAAAVMDAYTAFAECSRFVRVPATRLPEVVAVAGSNFAEIKAVQDPDHPTNWTCFGTLDNLIKGGAGQAVQNMNLMFGFAEDCGLTDFGGFP